MASSNTKAEITQKIAIGLLVVSIISITLLGLAVIIVNKFDSKDVLYNLLPVYGTWIGTVLAFYFGAKNYESASEQSRALYQEVQKSSMKPQTLLESIMRKLSDITFFTYPDGATDKTVTLNALHSLFTDNVTRLPILKQNKQIVFMIHKSQIDQYLANGGALTDTLSTFIAGGDKYSLGKGFIILAEETTVSKAQGILKKNSHVQDVFITDTGKSDEPIMGWISNVRLTKELKS